MEITTWDSRVLGVVFDLSLRHASDGVRVLDHAKQAVINYVRDVFEDDDVFYLFHPYIIESMYKVGESVAAISNYETDGWSFDLNFALTQTLYILDAEHIDFQKYLVLITDRLNPTPIRRLAKARDKDLIECQIVVLSLNSTEDWDALDGVQVVQVDATSIDEYMKEHLTYGPDAGCDTIQTDESCK